jgi:antitoxin component YwqK of YwqJK toxin-antitoxin module
MPNTRSNNSSYLAKVYNYDHMMGTHSEIEDCKIILSDDGEITIMGSNSNKVYLQGDVNVNNVYGTSRKNYNSFKFDLEMFFDGKQFLLQFDASSASAKTNFVEKINKISKMKYATLYYKSGNIKLEGLQVDGKFTESCIQYYDRSDAPIQYMGLYEDGVKDGPGEFFSKNGELCLQCNNICNNVPNGKAKLIVGRNKQVETLEMKEYKEFDSCADNYTDQIYSKINPEYETMMELVRFERMDTNQKIMYLFTELQKLKVIDNKPVRKSIFNLL